MLGLVKRRIADMGTVKALCLGAESEARRDGQREPGAEHFLLAALDLPDGTARRAFMRAGADPAGLRDAIAGQYADALAALGLGGLGLGGLAGAPALPPAPPHPYEAAASGKEVMQALAAGRGLAEPTRLTGAHVVAIVAAMPHGVAARALRTLGVDAETLRRAALEEAAAG